MNAIADIPKFLRTTVPIADWAGVGVRRSSESSVQARLRADARESITLMQSILQVPLLQRVQTTSEVDTDDMPEAERASYFEKLNSLLDVVRATRQLYEGAMYQHFLRLVRDNAPDLAVEFASKHMQFVEYSLEFERILVLFGAGTDDDAELIADVVPHVA